jgi:hypothetical protein
MNGLALRKDDIPLHSARGLVEGEMPIYRMTHLVPLTVSPAYRSDNQGSERFFGKYKAQIVTEGLKAVSTVVYETVKLPKFHSEHDRKELQFHMKPIVTPKMWRNMATQHRMVMACVVRVTPDRNARSVGASQGRLNHLSQSVSTEDKQVLFTKSDMAAICIPSSEFLFKLDLQQSKSATEIRRLIKEEQELYVSLLYQHTNLEGKSGN